MIRDEERGAVNINLLSARVEDFFRMIEALAGEVERRVRVSSDIVVESIRFDSETSTVSVVATIENAVEPSTYANVVLFRDGTAMILVEFPDGTVIDVETSYDPSEQFADTLANLLYKAFDIYENHDLYEDAAQIGFIRESIDEDAGGEW